MLNLLSGIQIDGPDAKKYCAKPKEEKIEFLIKQSKVTRETAEAFVEKPLVHADGKRCCGGHAHKKEEDGNQSASVQKEAEQPAAKRENKSKNA